MMPINRYLDAAILEPKTTQSECVDAIMKCVQLGTRTVCVRPCDIPLAQKLCAGTETQVCVVLGFPHGNQFSASKADEARHYVALGVAEIDMVANYGWARSGRWEEVEADITAVSAITKPVGVPLKVIFETSQLDVIAITRLTKISISAGADFVKTATGFNGEGATDAAILAMLSAADNRIKVKASGGIRDRIRAEHFIALGAHRLGVNHAACEAICKGTPAQGSSGY